MSNRVACLCIILIRSLPVSTLPSPTATDLQEVISGVSYGPKERQLTEDQVCHYFTVCMRLTN